MSPRSLPASKGMIDVLSHRRLYLIAKWLVPLILVFIGFAPLSGQSSSVSVSFGAAMTVCGQAQTATVTITALDTLRSITAAFDLSSLGGIDFDSSTFSTTDLVTLVGTTFTFPDLEPPTTFSASFTIDFLALCEAIPLGELVNALPIDFTYLIDGVTMENITATSLDFGVTKPGLDFKDGATDMFRPVVNEPDTITKTIFNAGDGDIDSALYFVLDHPNLSLCEIYIEGVDGVPNGNFFSLEPAGIGMAPPMMPDTLFYWIGAGAIIQTGNLDIIWDGLAGGQESFIVHEVWKGFDCVASPPDIVRGIGYGCEPGNSLALCTSQGNNSTVVFDRFPDLQSGQYDWGEENPACYADVKTEVGYFVTNEGEAPADRVVINLSTSSTGNILAYRYSLTGPVGPYTDALMGSMTTSGCSGGVASLTDTVIDANLAVGDTMYIQVEMLFDCACNPGCGISGIYRSDLAVEAIDRCGDGLVSQNTFWPDYAVSIGGFVEGSFQVKSGESGCVTYTITGYRNNWFNGSNSDSYYEMDFNFPAGLEMDTSLIVWEDAGGDLFKPDVFAFTDGDPMMDDAVTVRWYFDSIPTGWSAGAGTQISICYDAVCDDPCAGDIPLNVTAQMDFVIDPTCVLCTQEEAFCPLPLPMELKCYTPGGCMCDGISVLDLDIDRVNYGMGDNNNNACPEGGETIDFGLVETKRYLQGDTLKATVNALIHGTPVNPWINSTFQLVTQTNTITPLGGEIRIFRGLSTYMCDVLNMTIATSPTGDTIGINLDTSTLHTFCPGVLPSTYTFADGDSLVLCLFYTVKDTFVGQQRPILYETIWTIDDGMTMPAGCNQETDRLTQIGISESYTVDLDNPFGGCETTNGSVSENRYFGSRGFDEFPFEVRKLGIPEEFVYIKPSEFAYVLDMFGFRLQGAHSTHASLPNFTGGDPSLAGFILVSGDTLTFKAGDYLRSLNSMKIPPDEGYIASFYPRIQGDCRSFAGTFNNSTSLTSSVEEITYCTPLIERADSTQMLNYTGGPQLLVTPDAMNIVVDQPNQCFSFTLDNTTTISAPNSFLYITSPTGNIVVNSLIETTGGDTTPISGTPLGIYQLGFTAGSPDRTFDICVTANACGEGQLDFIAGWDCNQYPTTVLEATCQDPSVVTFSTGTAGLGLLVTRPSIDTIMNLCDTLEYEVILNSTMAGSLRDVVLSFDLPVGHEYISGSFKYMWPQIPPSGFISTADPDNPYGNFYTINATDLDPLLASDGLPGNGPPNNAILFRFKVATTCDVVSGSVASFFANALNACGDPVNNRFFPGKRIFIDGALAAYDISLNASDLILNPCTMDMSIVDVDIVLTASPGVMTMVGDTVRAVLPPGIFYKPSTYTAIANASMLTDPIITDLGGQQVLDWPILTGLTNGTLIQFNFGVVATDASQECRDYDMLVQTFSTEGSACTTGGPCDVGVETGSDKAPFSIVKPSLVPQIFDGMLIQLPPNQEVLMYTLQILNNSTIGLPMGTVLPIKIYEDVDNSGTPTPADILLSVNDIVLPSIPPAQTFEVMASDTFPGGTACTLIAVIDPDTACVCSLEPSNQLKPQIKFDFPRNIEICSNVDTLIGPSPIPGYDYTWLPVDGAYLGALANTDTTRTSFQYQNSSTDPITYQYALRSISKSCFIYDTVLITVFPSMADTVVLPACMGVPVLLPGPVAGSGFLWTPSTGLDDPTLMFPTVLNPTMDQRYSLNYTDENGCPANLTVDVTIINCVPGTALGDTIWFDQNMNGIFDPGELPIPGAIVLLFPANNPTGPHIRVDTTDANGMYLFDNLTLGNYIVKFIPPPGFDFTIQDIGNDSLDSDANPATGFTGPYFINNGMTDSTVDAGLISPCNLSINLNVGPCRMSADTMIRTATLAIDWTDAVYTYDFLFGEDTIYVNYLGQRDTIIVDTLFGSDTIMFTVDNMDPANFMVTAGFALDTACTDTVTAPTLVPCFFDLALTKVVDTANTSFPLVDDDTIKFLINLYNQGTVAAQNIKVKDQIPCGFILIPNVGDLIAADSSVFFNRPIPPGGFATKCVYVRYQQPLDLPLSCTGTKIYENYAEIFSAEDLFGDNPTDGDSEPNSKSPQELAVVPNVPGDNDTTSTGINDLGSEDDSDPANVLVFDLALRKSLDASTPGPYFALGDTVKYLITVFNQGNIIPDSVVVTDTLFDGLEFINSSLNPGWTSPSGNMIQFDTAFTQAMAMGTDTFLWRDTFNICLYLRVNTSTEPNAYINMAKITSARDTSGTTYTGDNDSPFDTPFLSNPGGAPGSNADDFVGGIGTGTPGSGDPRGDGDSHDPALFLAPVFVGDTAFVDLNLDGLQGPLDPGLKGVTVTLFQIDPATGMGIPVTTDAFSNPYNNVQVTNAMGAYLFDSLPHGQYYVIFDVTTATQGDQYIPTTENINGGSLDPNDSDANSMGISDTTMFLLSNQFDLTLDAGWYFPVTVGDTTFIDMNYNGLQDPTDPPLAGVTVTLRSSITGNVVMTDAYGNSITGMTITDANGFYLFDSLPIGGYYVEFDVSTVMGMPVLAPTLENVNGSALDPVDSDVNLLGLSDTASLLMSGDTNLTLDAGYFFPVVVGDTLFVDVNYNGLQDGSDLPLAEVTVTLRDALTGDTVTTDAFGNVITGMTLTNADGFYLFDSLPPGTYFVEFDVSTVPGMPLLAPTLENVIGGSLDPSDSDVNSLGYSDTVAVRMSGDSNLTLDAGYYLPVVVGDTLFVDVNYDGLQDGSDLPLAGVTVTLRDALTGDTVTTDAFGNVITGMTLTNADGFYLFDSLPPGTYFVEFDVSTVPGMPLLAPTLENVIGGSLDPNDSDVNSLGYSDTAAVMMSGDSNLTLDAGYYFPVVLGDTVFVDTDYNGLQDPSDPPLQGVTVVLLDAITGDTVMTDAFGNMITGLTQTDTNGFYLFDSLAPGTYYVMFDVSTVPGMPLLAPTLENINGTPLDPFDSDINLAGVSDTAALTMSGDSNLTLDAGYFFPAALGDTAFVDVNHDGRQGPDDLPLSGITVTLYSATTGMPVTINAFGDPIVPLITDMNGAYLFDSLPPGTYYVVFDPSSVPNGLARTLENVGDTLADSDINDLGVSDTVMLMMGDTNLTLDAGYYPIHSIGNQIWVDANNNGILDPGEDPIPNVEVILHYIDAMTGCVAVDTVVTDGLGLYLFDSLIAGDYIVEISADNFAVGGPLEGYASSSGGGADYDSNTTYEDPNNPIDPDDPAGVGINGDDNGVADGNANFPGSVVSDTLSLNGNEPQGMQDTVPNNDLSGALDSLSNLTVDFGFVPLHSIGNQLWVDTNNNGIIDPGEDPLSGVDLILHYVDFVNGCVAVDTVTTDINGLYLFDSLIAGDYIIEIPAYNLGTGGAAEGFASSTGAPAGMGPYEAAPDGDVDITNGDDNGTLNGNATFPGSIVSDTLSLNGDEPQGMQDTVPNNDMSGALDSLSNLTMDFGLFAPVSLGDTVWIDLNEDGINDPGEMPIQGVTVTLYVWDTMTMMPVPATTDAYGSPILPVMTDANGFYTFDSLPPGNYLVLFDVSTAMTGDGNAANWQITYQNQGMSDSLDSDADELTGLSDTTGFLTNGVHNPTLDAGVFPPRYDLALTKGLAPGQSMLVNPNDTVTMWILVANQGNVPSKKYTVNDILPSGMEFVDAIPMESFAMDSVAQWCDSLPDIVGINNFAVDTLIIRAWINPVGQGLRDFQFRNWAEISQDNAACYAITEEDSSPDDDTGYDDDDGPGTPPNDPFVDAMLGDVLLDSLPNDEDDSDLADLFTRRFDLAINKVLSPSEPDNIVLPADTVSFDIKVYNQGNDQGGIGIPADNITIVDYVPVNLILVEENGWSLVNDSLASRVLEVGDELMMGGLEPDSCLKVSIRFVMTDEIIVPTVNTAEIANATDTAGIEILDFDSDLDSMNMDVNVNDSLADNAFEMMDLDGDGIIDEDDSDFAEIISCVEVNCLASINVGLGPDCQLEITPDLLLADPRVARARPDFYMVTLQYFDGPIIPGNTLGANSIGRRIKATIEFVGPAGCPQGTCWTEITVRGAKQPFIKGTIRKTMYCLDPFLQMDPTSATYPRPTAFQSCSNSGLEVQFVGDWVDVKDCVLGEQDTAKIIYREWAATSVDGVRASAFDTIVVLRPPAISLANTFCASLDTLYCGQGDFGPYMVLPDVCPDDGETDCDTIYFMDPDGTGQVFDSKCGLAVHVDRQPFGSDGCTEQVRYRVEIKQSCYGRGLDPGMCVVSGSELEISGANGLPIYAVCDFWVMDIDTSAPVVACKYDEYEASSILWAGDAIGPGVQTHCYDTGGAPVLVVSTGPQDCEGHFLLPLVCVYEDWSGIKQVKATIEGVGTYILNGTTESCVIGVDTGLCYTSSTPVRLAKGDGPIEVMYEVYDSCHNVGRFSCWILVKDQTKPVAVVDKGVTVSMSSKKIWVEAEVFDEGSLDNCGLNQVLARRTDWAEACIDLCDSVVVCYIGEHGDTLWQAILEEDHEQDSIEAYYADQLAWWRADGAPCGALLWNGWQYDLMKQATQLCGGSVLDSEGFRHLFEEAFANDTFANKFIPISSHRFGCEEKLSINDLSDMEVASMLDAMEQIGGGWSAQISFSCSDACANQRVEILALDYWCNWGKAWSDVWVEDKTPVQVVREVTSTLDISCSTYKSAGIDALVALAEVGATAGLSGLDAVFGGYTKGWIDPYGNYVDANGARLPTNLILSDVQSCTCTTDVVQVRVYDDHLGYIWKDSTISTCYNTLDTLGLSQGTIAVNCANNVTCDQEVWSEFDHCGQGYIYRKWKFTQSCPVDTSGHSSTHIPDTITRIQQIWVGNNCELSKYMFTMPADTTVDGCMVDYATDGSGLVGGAADPSITGSPEYLFDDDCRIVGVGRSDKVFKVVGGDEACYKIIRTWYVADWCGGKPLSSLWWTDRELVLDSFVQKIILRDTVPPVCAITGPVEDGGVIEASGCVYNLSVQVSSMDVCGLLSYVYELQQVDGAGSLVVSQDQGASSTGEDFLIAAEDLGSGEYKLRVRLTDECQNESYCTYGFTIETGEKPSAICVSSLTATLNGMDMNADGTLDTAMALVWASEFDASSSAACGGQDSLLEFRVERIDGINDDTWEDDTTFLLVGCPAGVRLVRMWVIDPSGTADYCDVLLEVEDVNNLCTSTTGTDMISTITAETEERIEEAVRQGEKDREIMGSGDAPQSILLGGHQTAFALYQNRPNPFRDETAIGFYLPKGTSATLTIYDSAGRVVHTTKGDYPRGYHQILLGRLQVEMIGLLYYQIDTPEFTATRKMILVH